METKPDKNNISKQKQKFITAFEAGVLQQYSKTNMVTKTSDNTKS